MPDFTVRQQNMASDQFNFQSFNAIFKWNNLNM